MSAFPSNMTRRLIWWMWHNYVFIRIGFEDMSAKEELPTNLSLQGHTRGEDIFNAFVGFVNKTKLPFFNYCW